MKIMKSWDKEHKEKEENDAERLSVRLTRVQSIIELKQVYRCTATMSITLLQGRFAKSRMKTE